MGVFQLMLIISLSAVSRAHKCSDPWKEIEGDCWGFFGFAKGINGSWNNAKLECHRKGAVLGYPRTNAAFKDILRETKASSEFTGWKWLKVGLHSTTVPKGTYIDLENGKEPNEEIPWTERFPTRGKGWTCVLLNIAFDSDPHRPGLLINSGCYDVWANTGYACKNLASTTTNAAKNLTSLNTLTHVNQRSSDDGRESSSRTEKFSSFTVSDMAIKTATLSAGIVILLLLIIVSIRMANLSKTVADEEKHALSKAKSTLTQTEWRVSSKADFSGSSTSS